MDLGPTWQDGVEDAEDQPSKVESFLTAVAKLRNAESHKDVVGIEKWTKHLEQKYPKTWLRNRNTQLKHHHLPALGENSSCQYKPKEFILHCCQ